MGNKPVRQDTLRAAAEAQLARAPATVGSPSPAEKMLNDLRVHQIELEMQNEALRQAQITLEESRDRYVDLYDFAPVGYITLTREATIAEMNLAGAVLFGVERKKLLHRRFAQFVVPEDNGHWHQYFMRVMQHGERQGCELALKRGDGSVFHAHLDCLHMKTGSGGHSVRIALTDTTERKRAVEAVIKAGEKFHTLFDSISDAVLITGMDGRFILVNSSACERLGYTQEELLQTGPADIDTPEFAAKVPERIKALQERGKLVCESEHVRKDGVVIPIELSARIIDYNGRPAILAVARDITERKKAEAQLKNSEERLRQIIQTSMDGFWMLDNMGRLLDVNEAYCQMMGYSREELLTMTILDVEAKETPDDIARHIQQVKTQGHDRFETRHRRKDGQLLDIEVSSHFVPDGRSPQLLGFLRDITERKQIETQRLAHSMRQRDALVREVHHHIKNTLQGVAALLQQQVEESPEAGAALKKAIARIRSVAVVYGLQGEAYSECALCDMVRAISQDLQELTPLPLRLEMAPHFKSAFLADTEKVPIALIVNELLFNAVKHGAAAQADQAIHIVMQGNENEMCLIVYDLHGRLPQDFDFAGGCGLGTGLTLVKSLLPSAGASLSIVNADGGVRAELRLSSPVLIHTDAVQGTS